MIAKLDKISPGVGRFSRSQFLTDSLLNQLFDHFDDQIRLSRVNLSGVGIICGFEVSSNANIITIEQGLGITTDGDLFHLYKDEDSGKTIKIPNISYKYYRVYDNSKANYSPFFYQDDAQIELFELLTEKEDSETIELGSFSGDGRPGLEDMVVLLYLENYERNINKCSGLNCDGEGIDVVANYRMLMTTKANAALINSHDNTIKRTNYHKLYYQLPEALLPKIILGVEDFENVETLFEKLASPFDNEELLNNIINGFSEILDTLNSPGLKDRLVNKIKDLFVLTLEDPMPLDIQYRYDLLKDIVDTYNEIKSLILSLSSMACYADYKDFPKHLMLGQVSKKDICHGYRHGFYNSIVHTSKSGDPCFDCNGTQGDVELQVCYDIHKPEQRLFSLLLRAIKQLENYNPGYNEIEITPSRIRGVLGQKAIPFYHNIDEEFIKLWDFDKSARSLERSNISYHAELLDTDNPLSLCIDKDFYRIEGHHGKNYKDVLEELRILKRNNAVSFNIVALKVSNDFFAQDGEVAIARLIPQMLRSEEDYTSYYISNRPGLEHKAGVTPRGTFVLVFLDDDLVIDPIEIGEGDGVPRRRAVVDTRMEGVINPVIADFMVPYLYCDESIPALKLPEDEICFGNDTEPIPFDVTPKDGFVVALVLRGLNGGVVRNANGRSFFDPRIVSPELVDTPIRFEVNNQDTDAVITIHRKPEPIITTTVVYDNPFKTEATVTYNVSGPFVNEITEFEWDFFGDGNLVNIEPDASGNVVRQYQNSPESAPTTITSKLTVKTKFCENEIIIDPITFEDPIVIELDFDRNEICVNPADCDIPVHIALIVDESGSIGGSEITEIKDGLRAFIEDQEGSNNVITLLNMHDTDNGRPLNIIDELPINSATKGQFTQWIDNYRTPASGASGGSHFWTSGIGYLINDLPDVDNNLKTDPDIVILIADGVVASDAQQFKDRVAALNSRSHIFFYALTNPNETAVGYGRDLPGYLRDQVLDRPPIEVNPDFSNIETTDYGTFTSFSQLGVFLTDLKQILDNSIGCLEQINVVNLKPETGQIVTMGIAPYNGLQIDGRVITINPKEFEAFGNTIRFSVDGFATEETLIVERAPQDVSITINEIVYNEDRTKATVTFGVSGNFLPVFPSLLWNFGDGTDIQEGSELAQKHEYTDIAVLPDRTASVSLEIANPICGPVTQSTRVVFEDIIEEIAFSIPGSLCLDTGVEDTVSIPFDVSPAGAKVSAVTRTVGMRVGTNEVSFDSISFAKFDVPIAFTVNDQPVPATITVSRKPNVDFLPEFGLLGVEEGVDISEGEILGLGTREVFSELVGFNLENLNQFDETRYKYTWDFGDNSTSEERNPVHRYRFRSNVVVTVVLKVSDGICETEARREINLFEDQVM